MTEKKFEKFDIGGNLPNAVYAVFRSPLADHHYYVAVATKNIPYEKRMRWTDLYERFKDDPMFKAAEYTTATPLQFENEADQFYMAYVEDCASPPIAIVRANDVEDALEIFVDELPWSHLDDAAVADWIKDGREDDLHFVAGQAYDHEQTMIHGPLELVRIDFE